MSLLDSETPLPDSPAGSSRSRRYHFSTLCATVENPGQKDQYNASAVPIYQTATFKGMDGPYDYTRSGNPTRSHLEHHIAKISSAHHAFAVSSGMAALDVMTRILKPGDEVVAGDDLYGGTNRLLVYLKVHTGVIVHHVDTTDPKAIIPWLSSKTTMVLLESPTNPLLKIADLAQIACDVKERAPNAIVVVDNTMMSPYLQRPLEHGADLVYDSGTKYLSGHHDLMAGIITCNRDDLAKHIAHVVNSVGNALSPFDSFLLLRGIKTLAIRVDRQQATAMRVASYLHGLGFTTYYPGLLDHPGREIHERLANGTGAVLSFITGDKELSERIVGATRLWGISVSFGAVNSLISMPCLMSHASIDPAVRAARGLPEDLIRLCVGIEDADDLIEDLEFSLLKAGAITQVPQPQGGMAFTRLRDASDFGGLVGVALEKLTNNIGGLRLDASLGHGLSSSGEEGQPPTVGEFMVSAPGKIILFGEHAVVYGVTAIAASVDLRCYGRITPRRDGKLLLSLPDLNSFEHAWDVDKDLPWSQASSASIARGSVHPDALNVGLIETIERHSVPPSATGTDPRSGALRGAIVAFLYLYMSLSTDGYRPCFTLTIRSALPVGAGLGSSAAYSVCIATSLLLLYNRISYSSLRSPALNSTVSSPGPSEAGHSDADPSRLPRASADEVNSWAFVSEKILHGNPSGVDNSVATFGGGLAFTRSGEIRTRKAGIETISGFKSINFLLTDSKVPRDTKSLVASVGLLKQNEPELVLPILNSIQSISDQAQAFLGADSVSLPRPTLLSSLEKLVDENHALLASLGVSHPALEAIRAVTAAAPFGLHTKLTGAGGGGCTVTLLPDDFKSSSISPVLDAIREAGFDPYLTCIGGKGMGIHPSPSISEQTFASISVENLVEAVTTHSGWFFV